MGQNIGGQGIGPGPALPGPGSETVALPDAPVGEAPPPSEPPEQRVAAVPEGQGVLTRAGELFRSEEHTSELQSLMRISYAVFCLTKNKEHSTSKNAHVIHARI